MGSDFHCATPAEIGREEIRSSKGAGRREEIHVKESEAGKAGVTLSTVPVVRRESVEHVASSLLLIHVVNPVRR